MLIQFSLEKKKALIEKIQAYVYEESGEQIGQIAAENHLQFILDEIAPYIYNEGINDAKKLIQNRLENIVEDLYSLERPL